VHAPGDLEAVAYSDRIVNGVPLNAEEFAQFRRIGLELPGMRSER
jgi:hypothetical protein